MATPCEEVKEEQVRAEEEVKEEPVKTGEEVKQEQVKTEEEVKQEQVKTGEEVKQEQVKTEEEVKEELLKALEKIVGGSTAVPRNSPKAGEESEEEETEETDSLSSSSESDLQVVRRKIQGLKNMLSVSASEEETDDSEKSEEALSEIITVNKTFSYEDRVSLFCDQILAGCSVEDVDEALNLYIKEKLDNCPIWTAMWKMESNLRGDGASGETDSTDMSYTDVFVEVLSSSCDMKSFPLTVSVHLAESLCSHLSDLRREQVEDFLLMKRGMMSILSLYPVQGQGAHVQDIAEALEHTRFFYNYLWRGWDDKCGEDYAGVIETRLQLYYDIEDGFFPTVAGQRYRQILEEYISKRRDFSCYQMSLEDEMQPSEAVECWKKYYEAMMLCGFLQFWEDLKLRNLGPAFQRIHRRRRGPRTSRRPVAHIVSQMMTKEMVSSLSADTVIQQHHSLSAALSACFSGDTVLLFPGEYHAPGLAALTDDITIRGEGERQEVVLLSDPAHHGFVASRASDVSLVNLTLVHRGGSDSIVVVEAGQMTLDGCILKCDGSGVLVLTGATLFMRNCDISGAKGPGLELFPCSAAFLLENEIHHCCSQEAGDPAGAVSIKVLPKPRLRMSGNRIHDNNGYAMTATVLKLWWPDSEQEEESPNKMASGDQSEDEELMWDVEEFFMELNRNQLENNRLGKKRLLHYGASPT